MLRASADFETANDFQRVRVNDADIVAAQVGYIYPSRSCFRVCVRLVID